MESSEEDDDFPSIESVTPQSKIDTIYQSKTEKGIRKLCFELLDMKDAVENLCGNTRSKYLAFLRLSEEVVEVDHELNELRKHISAQRILVQDLTTGVCHELDKWARANGENQEDQQIPQICEVEDPSGNVTEDPKMVILANIDVLLTEHEVEAAIEMIDTEERQCPELKGSPDTSTSEPSSYKSAFLKRKAMLEDQLVEITEQPFVSALELKKALSGLLKLGKGPLAHQLLVKSYGSRLHKRIEAFLPRCPSCPETYPATLSNLVFSSISLTTRESVLMFGDNPVYTNRIVQWAEWEVETFLRLVKESAPPSETIFALRAATICVQASLNHCTELESQGLKLSKLLLVLLQPYIEEVLELNFRRARKLVLDFSENDEIFSLSPCLAHPLSTFAASDSVLIDGGMRFIFVVKGIVEQLTPLVILHFGVNILSRISQLFDKYIDFLIKALPSPSEDDNLMELKDAIPFRAETDSQQLALLGIAFTVADELLPMVVSRIWSTLNENKESGSGPTDNVGPTTSSSNIEFKDWRRHIQQALDKLRDHFCRQYVVNFIYSRDGKTRMDAQIYLIKWNGEDLFWDSDPLPSLPFQALFGKLQQLAIVAGDVLVGKEKIQKNLLARLMETVVMWLSNEQEFWGVLEDGASALQPLGLQQLILDMHFTVEIARYAGYQSRHVHQIASAIIARAIRTFSARGIDPQSALPEDEWFVETAKTAITKLLMVGSGSDTSEIDDEHLILHDDEDISDSDGSPSSLSSVGTSESFVSADMGELESPEFTDPET